MEAFKGSPDLVYPFLSQDTALLTKIDELTQKLPFTTAAEIGAVFNEVSTLRENYVNFLTSYLGNIVLNITKVIKKLPMPTMSFFNQPQARHRL